MLKSDFNSIALQQFTVELRCRSVISIKLLNFIETTLRYKCSPIYLLHIFRTPFPKNTSGGLLLNVQNEISEILKMFQNNIKFIRAAC